MDQPEKIGQRLLTVLNDNRMSQKELAAMLQVTPQTVSGVISGKSNLTIQHLDALKNRFGRSAVDYILFGNEDESGQYIVVELPQKQKVSEPEADYRSSPWRNASGPSTEVPIEDRLARLESDFAKLKEHLRSTP